MLRMSLILLTVFGLVGSALVHLLEWRDWAKDVEIIGPLFLLNVGAGVVLATAVVAWRHWLPALAAAGYGAATLGAYVLSLTVGLFGVSEQFTTAAEVWGVVTDGACILGGGLLLLWHWRSARVAA